MFFFLLLWPNSESQTVVCTQGFTQWSVCSVRPKNDKKKKLVFWHEMFANCWNWKENIETVSKLHE